MIIRAMMMCGLVVIASLLINHPASAHVVAQSRAGTAATVFHVTPDDSPIAGKEASMFFDSSQRDAPGQTIDAARLIVVSPSDERETVPLDVRGASVSGKYIFEYQGAYQLQLSLQYRDTTEEFIITQRVSRGTGANVQEGRTRHQWAEFLLVASGVSGLAIVVIVGARAKIIATASQ